MDAIDLCSGDEDVEYSAPLTEEIDFVGAFKTDWEMSCSENPDFQNPSKDLPAAYSQELGYVSLLSEDENDHAAEDQSPEHRVERSLSFESLSNGFGDVGSDIMIGERMCPDSKFRRSPTTKESKQRNKPVEKSTPKKICKTISNDKETKQREKILKKAMKENHKKSKTQRMHEGSKLIKIKLIGRDKFLEMATQEEKDDNSKIKENDFDYYLTKLLFEESTCCTKAESPEELAQIIMQSTKAVAETPFKLEKFAQDEKANFYMQGDNRECVSVDKNGNGSLRLWCQSLTKFPKAGLETAQAICEKYPSPTCLIQMLESETEENAVKILSDLAVRRAAGPLANTRRIGPELANKIFIFFTSTQGFRQLA